jgi:integration host factor subunit alpha
LVKPLQPRFPAETAPSRPPQPGYLPDASMTKKRHWATRSPLTTFPQANIVGNSAGYGRRVVGLAMAGKTITRADLCEAVYQKVGLSRTESAALVELVLHEITNCLERGETVKLSSFGSFVVRKKGQRIGRNPKTGKEVPISPRRVMVFKPSAILKQRINSSGGES